MPSALKIIEMKILNKNGLRVHTPTIRNKNNQVTKVYYLLRKQQKLFPSLSEGMKNLTKQAKRKAGCLLCSLTATSIRDTIFTTYQVSMIRAHGSGQ